MRLSITQSNHVISFVDTALAQWASFDIIVTSYTDHIHGYGRLEMVITADNRFQGAMAIDR